MVRAVHVHSWASRATDTSHPGRGPAVARLRSPGFLIQDSYGFRTAGFAGVRMLPAMSTTSPGIPWPRRSGRERGLALNLRRFKDSAPLAALLIFTGAVYLWGLSRNGYGNSYYAAAVQAGTHSWKAFLFGSLDASNYITVDKPPASLWLMEISSRVFGFSSFSMLLPQALAGVAAVGLLYTTV